jgi:hypothetical protein
MSEDRYVYPTEGEDPRDRDREFTDAEEMEKLQRDRQVTRAQAPEREQGTSADAPGRDPSDRDSI